MNAVISALARVALLSDGRNAFSIHVEAPDQLVPRKPDDIPFLLGDASDLQFFENISHEAVIRHLRVACDCEDALELTLILLDNELSIQTRRKVPLSLEELLECDDVRLYLANVFYARPLPESADIDGGLKYCQWRGASKTGSLLQNIKKYQLFIARIWQAWEAIPVDCFGTDETKQDVRNFAVRKGLFRKFVTILYDKRDIIQFHTIDAWLISLLNLFTRLIRYFFYWGQQDKEGIQLLAESFLETYLSIFPERSWDKDKLVTFHSSHVVVRLEDGKATWEGLNQDLYSVTLDCPIQPWELIVFSEMLKQLDQTDYESTEILRQAAVIIQSRLWLARLCDCNILRTVWRLLYDGPSRTISIVTPNNWIPQGEIPGIFSPWITWQSLGDDPASTLASLLPLGSAILTPKEFRLLVTRKANVPNPDLVLNILNPLLSYCPWLNTLKSYLRPCLGGLVSRRGEVRMFEAAIQFQEAGNTEEARKLWGACVACERVLVDPVDRPDLALGELLDLSHIAVTLRHLGLHYQAVPYVERFVDEWNKQGEPNKPKASISENDWWGGAGTAFRIHGLQLLRQGQQEEAISALQKAMKYYDSAGKPFWMAKVAYELYKVTRKQEFLEKACRFAHEATSKDKLSLPGGWLLRLSLLSETEADFQEIQTLYTSAYRNIDTRWRERFQFDYGVLLGERFPWEAAEHWIRLIRSFPLAEDKTLSIADQLLALVEQEPKLWAELVHPYLLNSSKESLSLGELWILAHKVPDQLSAHAFQHFLSHINRHPETDSDTLENLAEFCVDRAAEEPMGSEEREKWRMLSYSFNSLIESKIGPKWDKVVWTRKVRLALLGDATELAASLLEDFPNELSGDPYVQYYRAEVAYRRENYEGALHLLERLVKEGATDPRIDQLDRLYRVCMRLEDRERGEGILNTMLDLYPDDARALVALGHFKYRANDATGAAESYARAIQNYADLVDENGSSLSGRRKQTFNMTVRSLISMVREDKSIIYNARNLIESGSPEVVEAFAEQLRLMGQFDSVWSDILRGALKQAHTRKTVRPIAQYFMGRAIALAVRLYSDKDGTFEEWVRTVHQEFKDDYDLLAEFIAGAKETYLKCLRQLIERWASSPLDKDSERVLDWLLLEDPSFQYPPVWEKFLHLVTKTKGSRTYYHDVREQLSSHIDYTSEDVFWEFINTEISILTLQAASEIRDELHQFRCKASYGLQIAAAITISGKVPAVRSLWLPSKIFDGDENPHDGHTRHMPLWVDQWPLRITSTGLFGPEGAKETRPQWQALHDGSYSCVLKGKWGELKQAVWEPAQKLLAKQNISTRPRSDGLQIVLSPLASAIDIMA